MNSPQSDIEQVLVSVVMPVYNNARYLAEAMESVLTQDHNRLEVIVVDDGSTDDSAAIVESLMDGRVRLIRNGRNMGIVHSLNAGIEAAGGKYILRMDGDDVCLPGRINTQVRFMEQNPDTGLAGTWVNLIDEGGRVTGRAKNLTGSEELRINLLFSVPFYHPSVIVRADLLKEYRYDPSFPRAQDYELWTRLADKTGLANIPRYLLGYRWHAGNVSVTGRDRQEELKREINLRQIRKLGLEPSAGELDAHAASFSVAGTKVPYEDVLAWYLKLLDANRIAGIYSRPLLRAYLWSRLMVLGIRNGRFLRAMFSRLSTLNPRVLWHTIRLLLHFSGKKSRK